MKKLTSVFRSMSLREKLILSSLLCIILPGAVTISVFGYATKDVVKEDTVRNMEQKLELTDRYITEYFKTMIDTTNLIQFDVELNSILRQQSKSKHEAIGKNEGDFWLNSKKVREKIEMMSLANENLYITILLPNGISYTNYSHNEHKPEQFLKEPWFKRLDERKTSTAVWLGAMDNYILSEREKSPYVITVIQTLKRFSEKPYGYVIVSINESVFRDVLKNHASLEETMLIDEKGTILSHEDPNYIGQTYSYEDQLKKQTEYEMITQDDERYLFLKRPLQYSKMHLVSLTSYKTAVQEINDIYTRHIFLQVAFFSLFLLVLLVLVRRFTHPLIRLGQVASEVQRGELGKRSYIKGHDEIGMLGQSFDDMLDQINVMIERVKYEQMKKSEYEFKMLQAQIQPHFLFNILNSLRLRVMMGGDKKSGQVLNSLSALLRMAFRHDREFITVKEEIGIVKHYVELLNFRHQSPITLAVHLPPDCEDEHVPRLFLQPLIENAFHHGLQQEEGTIAIRVCKAETKLIIKVEDNGKGIDRETLAQLRRRLEPTTADDTPDTLVFGMSGIGLKNVHDRMRIIYGADFQLELESSAGRGTAVEASIPLRKRGGIRVQSDDRR